MTLVRPTDEPAMPRTTSDLGPSPKLSVVIASAGARSQLDLCLASLLPASSAITFEVVVARAGPPYDPPNHGKLPAEVRYVFAPPGAMVSELLSLGMAHTTGHIIVLAEDHWVGPERWLDLLRSRSAMAGPAVTRVWSREPIDWTAYLRSRSISDPRLPG